MENLKENIIYTNTKLQIQYTKMKGHWSLESTMYILFSNF